MKRILFTVVTLGAIALAVIGGAVVYQNASASGLAQTGTITDFLTDAVDGFERRGGPGGPTGPAGDRGMSDEDLAAELGISVEELEAAQAEARSAAISLAVEEGLITQAQADALAEGERIPFLGHMDGWLVDSGIDPQALLAEALGISVDELEAAHQAVFTAKIEQFVTDGDLTQEEADAILGSRALFSNEGFQTSMQSAFESAVAAAVADGVITQAQADAILSQQTGRGFGMPFGGPMGGRDGHMHP